MYEIQNPIVLNNLNEYFVCEKLNGKLYATVRKAARIYYSMSDMSDGERITSVKEQLGISESKAREYIQYAEQFRFSVNLSDNNLDSEPIENRIVKHSHSTEEEFFSFRRRQIIS